MEHASPVNAGSLASNETMQTATIWRSFFIPCEKPITGILGARVSCITQERLGKDGRSAYFAAVSALTGTSMSSLRMTRLVAFSVASSKPWPWVMASVGQASTQ